MTDITYTPVNKEQHSYEIGLIPKVGGLAIGATPISADVELPQIAYLFRVGDGTSGKTLVLEGADGNPVAFSGLGTGEEIVFETKKVLYQGVIDTVTYTTDVILLAWMGGQ